VIAHYGPPAEYKFQYKLVQNVPKLVQNGAKMPFIQNFNIGPSESKGIFIDFEI